MHSPAPTVLEYDQLPSGSGVVCARDESGLTIDAPAERFAPLARRMLRLPRFWTVAVLVWLSQTWFFILQVYRGVPLVSVRILPMLFITAALIPGMALGIYLVSRRGVRIRVEERSVTVITGGLLRQHRRQWERQRIREVRSNGTAVELHINRPGRSRPRKAWIMGGRDAAELAWVARELRRELAMELSRGA